MREAGAWSRIFYTLPLLLVTSESSSPSTIEQTGHAMREVGSPLAQAGDWGIMVYALLVLIFLLVVRDFVKDRAWQRQTDKLTSALEKSAAAESQLAATVGSFAAVMSRIEARFPTHDGHG